jgi:hypothetical protein
MCAVLVSEFQRHQVFQWFEEAMGPEKAAIMMDLLPPVGWGDIATKADLAMLRSELRGEIAELRGELHTGLADVRTEIADSRAQTIRTVVLSMLVGNAALVGLVLAAVQR